MGIQERKGREKEQRREDIIDAAEMIFAQKGLAAATMDEIAEAAELGKSTLYLYYKSKEDLYLAATMRGGEILYKMMSEATAGDEPILVRIRKLGESYLEFFNKYREYFRMYYFLESEHLHSQVSAEMKQLCLSKDQKIWGLVTGLVQEAIDQGILEKATDANQVAVMLWSNCNGLMRQIDRTGAYWKELLNVDLEDTMRKANALLVEALMTERAKKQFPEFVSE